MEGHPETVEKGTDMAVQSKPAQPDRKLKVISWNINGVKRHKTLLEMLIACESPDIIMIQEPKVEEKTIDICKIANYEHIATTKWRSIHNIVTYFKKGLTVTQMKVPEDLQNPTQKFKVRVKNGTKNYIIINTYAIHKNTLDIEFLEAEAEKPQNLIIAGDLNTKQQTRKQQIEELVEDHNMLNTNLYETPTFECRTPSQLDHIIISDSLEPDFISFDIKEYSTSASDYHKPIEAVLKVNSNNRKAYRRDWRKLKAEEYQQSFNNPAGINETIDYETIEGIEREVTRMNELRIESADKIIPEKEVKIKDNSWKPSKTAELLHKLKEKARKEYKKNKETPKGEGYRILSNKLDTELKHQINFEKREQYTKQVNKIIENPPSTKDFWKETNHLSGITKPPSNDREISYENMKSSSPEGKAKIHTKYQKTVFTENENITEKSEEFWRNVIEEDYREILNLEAETTADPSKNDIEEITLQEIQDNLKSMNGYKAPGPDNLPPISLKMAPVEYLERLKNLYNACLRKNHHPKRWKEAKLILIPKPGKDHSTPDGYRPLSMLNSIAKLYEKIMTKRLMKYIERARNLKDPSKPFLPDCQAGFRTKRSPTDNLFRFSHLIAVNSYNDYSTVVTSLDAQKAFDKVPHKGILSVLLNLHKSGQMPLYIVLYYKNFLEGRTFRVQQGDHICEEIGELKAGVPQGSHSGPALYNLYTADIPEPPEKTEDLLYPHKLTKFEKTQFNETATRNRRWPHLMGVYADDAGTAYACKQDGRVNEWDIPEHVNQSHMHNIEEWADFKKIKFNAGKTQRVTIHPRKNKGNKKYPKLTFCNKQVEEKEMLEYLGVKFDEKGTMEPFVKDQVTKTKARVNRVGNMIRNSTIDGKTAMHMMKTLAYPYVQYGSITWIARPEHRKTVNKIHHLARRRALRLPRGYTNTYMNQFLPEMDIAEWCTNINKKWYNKKKDEPSVAEAINTINKKANAKKYTMGVRESPLTIIS